MNFIHFILFVFIDSVPKASSPLLASPPTMTPGIAPPMTLPLSNVSPITTLPAVSPPLIPSAPSPVSHVKSASPIINQASTVQVASVSNSSAIVGQAVPSIKPAPPAAPSRKSNIIRYK